MDKFCELKLGIFSAMHRIINRSLHKEQAIEGLLGVISQAIPYATVAIIISSSAEVRFFFTQIQNGSDNHAERGIRDLFKTEFDLVFSILQPFAVLRDNQKPIFLDRRALFSIQKEQVRLLGCPITLLNEVMGVIMVDRFFSDQVPIAEDAGFLSMLTSFVAQILSLESRARRREESLVKENLALRAKISEEHLGLICMGRTVAVRKLESLIRKAAPAETPVLIAGEQGTGKGAIAQIIHELGGRTSLPFVKVHCSLPEDILERELFGNESDNGLIHNNVNESKAVRGAFEKATGGTLVLDEIGDLSRTLQVKLLDTLDKLHIGSLGGQGPRG